MDDLTSIYRCIELGADDYMPKPFEPEELIARIQSILRRIKNPETMIDHLEFEHLKIDKLKLSIKNNFSFNLMDKFQIKDLDLETEVKVKEFLLLNNFKVKKIFPDITAIFN